MDTYILVATFLFGFSIGTLITHTLYALYFDRCLSKRLDTFSKDVKNLLEKVSSVIDTKSMIENIFGGISVLSGGLEINKRMRGPNHRWD